VKDPKQWWGGHLWVDNAKKFIYMFQANLTASTWLNSDLARASAYRSYDDFLSPKWQGKIGFLDPRTPVAGDSNWAFMWEVNGEEYLKNWSPSNCSCGAIKECSAEISRKTGSR